MATTATANKRYETLADVLERVGHVPAERILLDPRPGNATEADLLDSSVTGGRSCELVDGILVEKAMGYREGYLAVRILLLLG
jgi:hypothetical protein